MSSFLYVFVMMDDAAETGNPSNEIKWISHVNKSDSHYVLRRYSSKIFRLKCFYFLDSLFSSPSVTEAIIFLNYHENVKQIFTSTISKKWASFFLFLKNKTFAIYTEAQLETSAFAQKKEKI